VDRVTRREPKGNMPTLSSMPELYA
jgi:hypothetical protein